jgi:hypothetical protein
MTDGYRPHPTDPNAPPLSPTEQTEWNYGEHRPGQLAWLAWRKRMLALERRRKAA